MGFVSDGVMGTDTQRIDGAGSAGEIGAFPDGKPLQEGMGKGTEEIVAAAGGVHRFNHIRVSKEPVGGIFEEAAVAAQLEDHIF